MEKSQNQNQNHPQETKQEMQKSENQNPPQSPAPNHKIQRSEQSTHHVVSENQTGDKIQDIPTTTIWDCGSALYDSFELNSFQRQLDSAIHARTMSMPHIAGNRAPFPLPPPTEVSKKSSKISRSFRRIFKSMFKRKQNYAIYGKSGVLATIPEAPEIDFAGLSPEFDPIVRKIASERFTVPVSSFGVSCA